MINPAPYNAEAPPEALVGEITPTQLHYVRSNFALPTHDGVLEIGGAVEKPDHPDAGRPAGDAGGRAGRHARVRRQRPARYRPLPTGEPWGAYAVSTARWTGVLLRDVLERVEPAADGVEVRFEGADRGAYHLSPILAETEQDRPDASCAPCRWPTATDPAAEILIAYEMNGEPLRPDHGAPFRLIAPHWYAVASVKWLKRIDVLTEPFAGEFQTGHYIYEWPDRPHEPVTPDARPRPDHRTRHRSHPRPAPTRSAEKPGPEPAR